MIIPWQSLEADTLQNVLESIILREGTDYGAEELSLAEKVQQLKHALASEQAVLVWSELHESLTIKEKGFFMKDSNVTTDYDV